MLPITALDLDAWASRQSARAELPVLVRRLVHARPITLVEIDFPGYESTDGGGWDGLVDAVGVDPWVPDGKSRWELSCRETKGLAAKAAGDLAKRTAQTPTEARANATFVFVTARRWPGKTSWRNARLKEGDWGDIRVIDAEGLAQWLEQAPAALAWMQARLGRSTVDLAAPEDVWEDWAGVTSPALPPSIFDEALEENRSRLQGFFDSRSDNVLDVSADTRAEAIAFAARLVLASDLPLGPRQRAVVAKTVTGLRYLKSLDAPLTILVPNAEVEAELGALTSRAKILVAHDKTALDPTTGACVEPLTWEAFARVAEDLGVDGADRERLDDECGRRISILRRRLSTVRGLRLPVWANEARLSRPLVGLALAGGWYWASAGDREVLSKLTGLEQGAVEAAIKTLSTMEDAPLFSIAEAGGVISRPDAFTALRGVLTAGDVERFVEVVFDVLSRPDPALDLPPDQRWYANVVGKDRPHSGRLRTNLADSLVFLAAASEGLVGGPAARWAVERLVQRLFEVEDPSIWFHTRDVLPALAEAAPDAFMRALERDLDREADDAGVWQLLKPVEGTAGENLRAGLLWGLERIAWSSDRFGRVATILAGLSARPLTDNWINKPASSLAMLFHPVLPQTGADEALQMRVLEAIFGRYPAAGWRLALGVIDQRFSGVFHSARPRYRPDAIGQGQAAPRPTLVAKVMDLVLGRVDLDRDQIAELIEKSRCFDAEDLARLWDRILAWGEAASEEDRAFARDKVRKSAFWRTRRRRQRGFAPDPKTCQVYDALQPRDLLERHKWLFKSAWVHFDDTDTDGEEELDHAAREGRVAQAQTEALREVWAEGGLPSLAAFAQRVECPWFLAQRACKELPDLDVVAVTELLLDPDLDGWPERQQFVGQAMLSLGDESVASLLKDRMAAWAQRGLSPVPLLLAAPPAHATWDLVDQLEPEGREAFWRQTNAYVREGAGELNRLCRELLAVGRATSAFRRGELDVDALEPDLIVEIITRLAYGPLAPGEDEGAIDGSAIKDYLEVLDRQQGRFDDQILLFEFLFCRHLEYTGRGIRAWSARIAHDPDAFVQLVEGAYKRQDGGDDEVAPEAVTARQQRAPLCWHILEHCSLSPGADEDGHIDAERFEAWMTRAVERLKACGRERIGRSAVGQIVGRTRRHDADVWPPLDLVPVLDRWADEGFSEGLYIGIINSRSAQWKRSDGGSEESELATRYYGWRRRVEIEAPRLAAVFGDIAASCDRQSVREGERAALRRAAPD